MSGQLIPPGSTIGILGGGQLGLMMAIAAKQMGYRVHIFAPVFDSPAGQVADLEIQASFDDLAAVEAFAKNVDVMTLETENIPVPTVEAASQFVNVYPGTEALRVSQNRMLEREFLSQNKIPSCRWKLIRSLDDLKAACQTLMPSVLKTTTGGYDGKGQVLIRSMADVESAWNELNAAEAILEEWLEFDFEFSIIGARSPAGIFAAYSSIRNDHQNQILDVSYSPSGLPDEVETKAKKIVFEIMDRLDAVGVLTVEFFYRNGEVIVNEIAPRPHNSGHLTIDAHLTDQFEQHIRAICSLMLGSTRHLTPAAMANLLGELWNECEPKWHLGMSLPNTKLHLYGKETAKPGRKMGHLTATGDSAEQAQEFVRAARKLLAFSNLEPEKNPVSSH